MIADRVDKRKLLIWVQLGSALLAAVLGVLVLTDVVRLWHVYVLAFGVGLLRCLDFPARQSFVHEIVSHKHLHNAVTLNSVLLNAARVIGPSIAGATIVLGGIGLCFLLNAVSFLAVVASLAVMNVAALTRSAPSERARLVDGFAYVRRTPALAVPLVMTGIIGCLAYEFPVVLPVVAERVLHGDARTYGFLTAAMGAGAILGGLLVSAAGRTGMRMLVWSSLALGGTMLLAAVAPNLATMMVALAAVGAATIATTATSNSTLQLGSAPQMRGRVMALWSTAMMGSTAIGAPVVGTAMEHLGARVGLVIGGVSCLVAALLGMVSRYQPGAVIRRPMPDASGP
ncbi:MFS transporter [Phytohabitans flavus]|uniref:MFS transporter n=1 Tax=Phytohabitans flavus TaxID=1076124 RepID=A0A6F8XVT7_9ACTN|nr:MFS transporter [Phytohabitans flavus]BCB77907.1 MFS transporter [Phytohabitans flavus]